MKGRGGGIGDVSEQCAVGSLLERMVLGQQLQNKVSVLGKCNCLLVYLGGLVLGPCGQRNLHT